jgi:hypothetical protein
MRCAAGRPQAQLFFVKAGWPSGIEENNFLAGEFFVVPTLRSRASFCAARRQPKNEPHRRFIRRSLRRGFDDADFVVGQAVKLIDKLVDLPVGRVNLPLNLLAPLRQLLLGWRREPSVVNMGA